MIILNYLIIMKLLISNQHGAIVMALVPFIYGMLLANPVWAHVFLLLGWFSLYLMTYPFLNLFKGKNLELYKKWSVIYFAAAVIFAIPALIYNWQVLYFMFAMLPFVGVNIYFTKKKDERNLWNDLAGILIFALAGMGSYYFSDRTFDEKILWVAIYPTLFFIGTTLYVKSMMRERKKSTLFLGISDFSLVMCADFYGFATIYFSISFCSWISASGLFAH